VAAVRWLALEDLPDASSIARVSKTN